VFREDFRVLKSGGRQAVSDIMADGPLPPELALRPDAWSCCLAGAMDRQAYLWELEKAGFVEIELAARQLDPELSIEIDGEAGIEAPTELVGDEAKPMVNVGEEWVVIESEGYRPPFSARIIARNP
jgi:hypothetical protein